jgi:hypothetical protein
VEHLRREASELCRRQRRFEIAVPLKVKEWNCWKTMMEVEIACAHALLSLMLVELSERV